MSKYILVLLALISAGVIVGLSLWIVFSMRSSRQERKYLGETQVCPRRSEGPAIPGIADFDIWERSRWGSRDSDKWPVEFEKPRTCSFCGGIHPDDAIKLIEAGWEIAPTDKSYKWYLEVPGSGLHHRRVIHGIRSGDVESAFKSNYVPASPPVNLYGQHCDSDQLRRLNDLLDIQRGRKPRSQASQ